MIVDASAIVAVMRNEPEGNALASRIMAARVRATHPISIYEATLAIARLAGSGIEPARAVVGEFLAGMRIDVVELRSAEAAVAIDAFTRYGKGRHPAALNMGDCFSYACAKVRGLPLLYKGEDFGRTDLARPDPV